MKSTVANCKKCKKVFQKVLHNLCSDCIKLEEEQFKILYRTLQKSASNGGITIDDLSAEVGISVEDIESFYREGRLSTAGIFLKFSCQQCNVMMDERNRKGRYCLKCSDELASKAGVEVKSKQALEKSEAQERANQERLSLLKKNQPPAMISKSSRYGFASRRG